jgi:hypothetical protein
VVVAVAVVVAVIVVAVHAAQPKNKNKQRGPGCGMSTDSLGLFLRYLDSMNYHITTGVGFLISDPNRNITISSGDQRNDDPGTGYNGPPDRNLHKEGQDWLHDQPLVRQPRCPAGPVAAAG